MKNSGAFYHNIMTQEQGKSPQSAHTPSSLNQLLKKHLATHWQAMWLTGEIFDLYTSPAGHQYFTLKDDQSAIKCVLFRQKRRMELNKGQKITVLAELSVYQPRGDLQLNVIKTMDAGVGDWEAELALLKSKLSAQGLFDAVAKKDIPKWVGSLAIVTSPNGAALHDVLDIIKSRNPLISITLYPSQVQGPTAPGQLISQLMAADAVGHDVILLTRGGGSKEDLWAFNDEFLARTIHQLSTPIISAVGHETDEGISDWVADLSCITPSAAAHQLAGDFKEKQQQLEHQFQLLQFLKRTAIQSAQQKIDIATHQLQKNHPKSAWLWQKNQLKTLTEQLDQGMVAKHREAQAAVSLAEMTLLQQLPNTTAIKNTLAGQQKALRQQIINQMSQAKHLFKLSVGHLEDRNPLHILSKGYSVTRNQGQQTITSADQVKLGETIETTLKSGKIRAQITERILK